VIFYYILSNPRESRATSGSFRQRLTSLHSEAKVILRPVNLLELDELLRAKHVHAQRNRAEFAHRLVFGTSQDTSFN
jgi:hypothetical protein